MEKNYFEDVLPSLCIFWLATTWGSPSLGSRVVGNTFRSWGLILPSDVQLPLNFCMPFEALPKSRGRREREPLSRPWFWPPLSPRAAATPSPGDSRRLCLWGLGRGQDELPCLKLMGFSLKSICALALQSVKRRDLWLSRRGAEEVWSMFVEARWSAGIKGAVRVQRASACLLSTTSACTLQFLREEVSKAPA